MAKQSCFIIMPIATPEDWEEDFRNDKDHFKHVLECLFIPAFDPIPPKSEGSSVIQTDIISNLATADLVLCDMSTWNPNVFFEFGIRTALDKPVALIADEKIPKLPFDISPMHCHRYDSSLAAWLFQDQIKLLSSHVKTAFEKNRSHNPLWKAFRIEQAVNLKPEIPTDKEIINVLIEQIRSLRSELKTAQSSLPSSRSGYSGYANENRIMTVADLLASQQVQDQILKQQKLMEKFSGVVPPSKAFQEMIDAARRAEVTLKKSGMSKAFQEMMDAARRAEETLKELGLGHLGFSQAPDHDKDEPPRDTN
jgi:hypothetical protein